VPPPTTYLHAVGMGNDCGINRFAYGRNENTGTNKIENRLRRKWQINIHFLICQLEEERVDWAPRGNIFIHPFPQHIRVSLVGNAGQRNLSERQGLTAFSHSKQLQFQQRGNPGDVYNKLEVVTRVSSLLGVPLLSRCSVESGERH